MPLVSVLLPCRNGAAFLQQCLASLEAQTFQDFEIVAVDDHSTDDTRAILLSCDRVRLLDCEGSGIVDALNTALRAARGPLLARMDADDVAHAHRFAEQIAALRDDPRLAACGTHVRYFPRAVVREGALRYEAWINSLVSPADLARDMFVECPIAHPTLMIRATEMLPYRDMGWPEDYDLILRLHAAGKRVANVPEVLLEWRERADRWSRVSDRYGEAAFRRCKAHYLRGLLDRQVLIWGAGPVGRAFAKELAGAVAAFIDVDPRKIGRHIGGVPVLSAEDITSEHTSFTVLAAVAGTEPRAEIRAFLTERGFVDGVNLIAVA